MATSRRAVCFRLLAGLTLLSACTDAHVTAADADGAFGADVEADATPDAPTDALPDADAAPDVLPDADAAPDAAPDTLPDADAAPDAAPPLWLLAPRRGTLAFMPGDACPTGWHVLESARGRLIKGTSEGSQVGLTVGTALTSTQPPVHTHAFTTQISIAATDISGATACCTGGFGMAGTHPLSGSTEPAADGMPTVHEVLCEIDAVDLGEDGHPFPAGAILFFNAVECPAGFENLAAADGRFIVGTPAGGTPGATVGSPLASGEIHVHPHQISASIDVGEKSIAAAGGGNHGLAAKGAHGFSVLSLQSGSGWPYIQLFACRALPNPSPPGPVIVDDSALPSGAVAWFESTSCPAGWSPASDYQGRLGVALAPNAAPATLGTPLAPFEDRLHSHGFAGTFDLPEQQVALVAGCCNKSPGAKGSYAYSGTSGPAAGGLAYLTLTACARD